MNNYTTTKQYKFHNLFDHTAIDHTIFDYNDPLYTKYVGTLVSPVDRLALYDIPKKPFVYLNDALFQETGHDSHIIIEPSPNICGDEYFFITNCKPGRNNIYFFCLWLDKTAGEVKHKCFFLLKETLFEDCIKIVIPSASKNNNNNNNNNNKKEIK